VENGNPTDRKANPGNQRKRSIGSRLRPDWEPPATGDLPLELQPLVARWPAGAYEFEAAKFRDNWLSEGRAIGTKRDWPRTWHNWLRRAHGEVLRLAKQGMDFTAAPRSTASPAEIEKAQAAEAQVIALQKCEPGCAALIREALRKELGERAYGSWIRPTLMGLDVDGALLVSAGSQFLLDQVNANFGERIRALAEQAEQRAIEVRWRLLRLQAKRAA
jgi:hypothetical protein